MFGPHLILLHQPIPAALFAMSVAGKSHLIMRLYLRRLICKKPKGRQK
jgi:hypothetical protein